MAKLLLDEAYFFEQEISERLGRNLTALRRFVVKEVILVHDIPSEEVNMIPLSPTVTNNPLELVTPSPAPPTTLSFVFATVSLTVSSVVLPQEIIVKMKQEIRKLEKNFVIISSIITVHSWR